MREEVGSNDGPKCGQRERAWIRVFFSSFSLKCKGVFFLPSITITHVFLFPCSICSRTARDEDGCVLCACVGRSETDTRETDGELVYDFLVRCSFLMRCHHLFYSVFLLVFVRSRGFMLNLVPSSLRDIDTA